jgi:hypothetical protein
MKHSTSPSHFELRRDHVQAWFRSIIAATILSGGMPVTCLEAAPPEKRSEAPKSSSPKGPSNSATIERSYDTPRIRYVHGTKATIRCGPSDQYYLTTTLPPNARVEVYRETSDGWSGIRPPLGSHNWIPAKNAFLLPGGKVAEITEDETPAWVGTESEQVKQLMWQTGLVKTQQVQILAEEYQRNEEGAKQLWYQINPPPGEFRWVRTAVLVDAIPGGPSVAKTNAKKKSDPSEQVVPARFEKAVGSGVAQAAALEEPEALPQGGDGEIVWSNESEVLSKVNREIAAEQSKIKGQMQAQGIPVSRIANGEESSLLVDDGQEVVMDEPMESLTPEQMKRAKRRLAAQHQTDSFKHWEALQNSDNPKFRTRPLSSVLGLVGLGIVEADRVPTNTEMMRARHEHVPQSHSLQHLGPVGSSRLDHLPRPGRRPGMSVPLGSQYDETDSFSSSSEHRPFDESRPVLDRLFSSNQPLFGPSRQGSDLGYDGGMTTPNSYRSYSDPHDEPNTWHGITSQRAQGVAAAMRNAYDQPLKEADFGTPEIQRAMLELSDAVSKPTEQWDLSRVRRQCEHWIDQGQTALVRGEARLLMDRIEQFDALRIRTLNSLQNGLQNGAMLAMDAARQSMQDNVSLAGNRGELGLVTTASATNPTSGATFAAPMGTDQGDASGWLVQVHHTLQGQPEYALTDDAGNVITYVRSTAALNLRRYLQQPVMVQGVRGYIPSLAAKQIVAERVVRLR